MRQNFITNLHGRSTRMERHQGREYLVAPVAMLVEGVHSGSYGPLYYPASELGKKPEQWNGKPIVVYHPAVNGQHVSAEYPGVLERQQVGTVKAATWDGKKLRAEAWLDVERLTALAPALVGPLLNDGGLVEVSTGLYTDNEHAPGWYGGKNFEFVARNHRPDHLALLPEGVGACAVADGCGLFQLNQHKENIMNVETGLPLPTMDFGYREGPTVNYAAGDGLPLPSMGYHAAAPVLNTGMDNNVLPLPSMGYEAAPVLNNGGGDRDDFLPLPVYNFGTPGGCNPVANAAESDGLPLPVMNFDSACGCRKHTANNRADGNGLPLPAMKF